MEKFIMHTINNKKGYIYNYVLIVILLIFSISSYCVEIIENNIFIEKTDNVNINLYNIGQYYIEESIDNLNKYICSLENEINLKTIEKIDALDKEKIIEFVKKDENLYKGKFYLKDNKTNTINNLYKKEYLNILNSYIKNFIDKQNIVIKNLDKYRIKISYYYDVILEKTTYKILCEIENLKNNNVLSIDTIIDYNNIHWEEIVLDNFLWEKHHKYFGEGIFSNVNFSSLINSKVKLPNLDYNKNYPVYVTDENIIDISQFYIEDIEQNTILIINNTNNYIYASNINKNKFKGIILCRGNLNILEGNYIIEGDIIVENNIFFNEEDVLIKKNKDLLFDTYFENIENKRIIYDFLCLTEFIENKKYPLIYFSINLKNSILIEKEDNIMFQIISTRII